MKKLFTLLTLALLSIGTAWADVNTTLIDGITLPSLPGGTYTGGTTVSHNGTNTAVVVDEDDNAVMQASAPGYGSPTADNFTWTNAANGSTDASWSTTGTTWDASGVFVGSTAYTTKENAHYVNFARRGNLQKTRTFAYRFTNCEGVSAYVKSQGTKADAAACLAVYEVGAGNALSAVETVTSIKNSADIITVDGLSKSKTYVAYVYGMNGSNGEFYEIAFLAPTTEPDIKAAATTIKTTTSGVEVTENIAVTGKNLAGSTLTATLSPAVTGLTVTLASNTISAGAISTTATLHYTATANARGTTTLSLSDGTTIKNVIVTYNASVVSWTLQSISSATTWDWSKVTPNSSNALYKNNGIALTDASDPDKNTEFVMENYAGGDLYTIADGFDGTTISFKGEYPCRYGTVCQNGIVKFNTTVPGKIVVKFNDTGSSASASAVKRYLKVNGVNTEYWTSRENNSSDPAVAYAAQMNVISGEIDVPAGDVTITGSSAIQIYYVTFTPTEQQVSTLSGRNYASYVTTQQLDFGNAAGITAYIATGLNGAGDAVELQAVDVVPAGTPIIVKTDTKGATVNVPVTDAAASDVSGNKLVAGDGTTAWNGTSGYNYYYLASDQFHLANAGTLQSGKAYLKVAETAAPVLNINFGETTGISTTNFTNDTNNSGEYYNLAGQRVAQPTKGLYIVNGKKVILK